MAVNKELKRVTGRIESLILEFAERSRGSDWHMSDLHDFINGRERVAPGSPDRVLRSLRAAGQVNYRVESRSDSRYAWVPLARPVQRELPVVA